MYIARSLSVAALFCYAVRGALTNYTLDDTSTQIVYTQTPLVRCSPSTSQCGSAYVDRLFNGTSTTTGGPIIVTFTGAAVYVYLTVVEDCGFNLDGNYVGRFINLKVQDDTAVLAFWNYSMPDVPHVLTIYPQRASGIIVLDYIVYSHNPQKSHVGTIVGGVVGGVAAIAIFSAAAYFIRRRQKRRRLSTRGIPLGDLWPDKPSIQMLGMTHQK
ncbi:hypothetical protein DFH06DRAFT_1172990 [Mycena polygramma]|nr:hypothetical protein DFH06DRAFT_1172990 [Mycena polygramma]